MSVPRLAAATLAALALTVGAGSATAHSTAAAPTNLHGFLLRADEPVRTSFPRTPAFAWAPVAGAAHYEFQLSTSDTFRDNGMVWEDNTLQTPVAAPTLTLPWITGSPHALFARVRAYLTDGSVTPWSTDYGFDMQPPAPPAPLPAAPGLLRWTPVEGADSYEVWLAEPNKREIVRTNVLDEREYYTFHVTPKWVGTVHWRVRALRADVNERLNGIPVTFAGAWSPMYSSSNPTFAGGQIHLGSTISDVVSNGDPADPAHRLMPAFTWTGNEALDGTPAELFRVYVFTDKQCLNRVFTGAVVGSPAYAPRPHGPLSLPAGDTASARGAYLSDGAEPGALTFDGDVVFPNEMETPAAPTLSVPSDPSGNGGSSSSGGSGSSGGGSTGVGSLNIPQPGEGAVPDPNATNVTTPGAPVDVWDTNWPQGGYYWTVVPVAATQPGGLVTSVAAPGAVAGVANLPVSNSAGFGVGDTISIGSAGNAETATVIGVSAGVLSLAKALASSHGIGEPVVRTAGALRYQDLEMPQDVCAAGRVARFGKESEPSLTSGGDIFVSGLSPTGKLTSATGSDPAFYGAPVISWSPALGAGVYEVQWSKTKYPFVPEPTAAGPGVLTAATSYVLPLAPGTWYYRVRGFDFLLPSSSQAMSWSDTEKVTIAQPTFAVVGGTGAASTTHKTKPSSKKKKSSTTALRTYSLTNFSIAVPRTWRRQTVKGMDFAALDPATPRLVFVEHLPVARGTLPANAWATLIAQQIGSASGLDVTSTVSHKVVTINGSTAALLTFRVKYKSVVFSAYTYVFDDLTSSYMVMFLTVPRLEKQSAPVFGRIVNTFRLH